MKTHLHLKPIALAIVAIVITATVQAGTEPIDLGNGLTFDWKLSTTYALSQRMKNPSPLLTGDPGTNDGNNNFKKGALTANRLSALFESTLAKGDTGFVFSASSFYDGVYHRSNYNSGPVNKPGPVNEFTADARRYHGGYSRILDAYAYTAFDFGNANRATIRLGRHAVNWGEALYFPNIAMAQGPFDGTKTGVPGTETKDAILTEDQISGSIQVNPRWSLLGQVQYNFHPTLAAAPGSFLSTSDSTGYGATCLDPYKPGSNYCPFGERGPDINPSKTGQWAIGTRYRITDGTEVGMYYMNYNDRTPLPEIDFAARNYDATYRTRYFDKIKLLGATVSTTFGPVSAYTEFTYRKGAPVLVGDAAVATRANISQLNVGGFYNIGRSSVADSMLFLGEISAVKVGNITPRGATGLPEALVPVSNKPYFETKSGLAVSGTLVLEYPGITSNWDMQVPISYSRQLHGRTILGGVGGQGDKRYSIGASFTKSSNLTIDVTYLGNIGKPSLAPKTERLETDRDQLSVSMKYIF